MALNTEPVLTKEGNLLKIAPREEGAFHFQSISRNSCPIRVKGVLAAPVPEIPDRDVRLDPFRETSGRRRLLRVSALVYRTRGRERTSQGRSVLPADRQAQPLTLWLHTAPKDNRR